MDASPHSSANSMCLVSQMATVPGWPIEKVLTQMAVCTESFKFCTSQDTSINFCDSCYPPIIVHKTEVFLVKHFVFFELFF